MSDNEDELWVTAWGEDEQAAHKATVALMKKAVETKRQDQIDKLWQMPIRRSEMERKELLLASIPTIRLSTPGTGDDKEQESSLVLDGDQTVAKSLMLKERMVVVTGGPGTGKTTTLKQTLDACDRDGISYVLAAPTGKAAIRIQQTTGRSAQTIHRLLEYHPDEKGDLHFHRNATYPLETDLVIIDEASMVDVPLGARLFEAIRPEKTRVVFMGDVDQLPSVGSGQVLADIIDSGTVPTVRLRTVHRAAAESWVCVNAPLVIRGEKPLLLPRKDFRFYERADPERLVRSVVKIVVEDMKGKEIQVLAPQNRGDLGIEIINALLQSELNPVRSVNQPTWEVGPYKIRYADRVIHCKNNYYLGVFNGEIGSVQDINEEKLLVDYGDRLITYDKAEANDLKLAYALTIHKSQGSEWGWVLVVCHSSQHYMLSRQLLYTAITRAKRGVIIVGDEEGIEDALANDRPRERETTLRQRLEM